MKITARKVHVYETDLMGIVHHTNYIRYCEEARVQFCVEKGLLNSVSSNQNSSNISDVHSLTVIGLNFNYKKPLRFNDEFFVEIQGQQVGVRLILQYKIWKKNKDQIELCVVGETRHCQLDEKMKIKKPDQSYLEKVKGMSWTETWL